MKLFLFFFSYKLQASLWACNHDESQLYNTSKDYIEHVFIPSDLNVESVDSQLRIPLLLFAFLSIFFLLFLSFFLTSMHFVKSLTQWRDYLDYHVMEQGTVEACHWADCGHQFSADDDISVSCYIIRMVGQSFGVVQLILHFRTIFSVSKRGVEHAIKADFHVKGFAQSFILKERERVTL